MNEWVSSYGATGCCIMNTFFDRFLNLQWEITLRHFTLKRNPLGSIRFFFVICRLFDVMFSCLFTLKSRTFRGSTCDTFWVSNLWLHDANTNVKFAPSSISDDFTVQLARAKY